MDQQRSLKPGRCEISRSTVGDLASPSIFVMFLMLILLSTGGVYTTPVIRQVSRDKEEAERGALAAVEM